MADRLLNIRIVFTFSLCVALVISFLAFTYYLTNGSVLQLNDTVSVGATVQNCYLRVRAYPEKRIPSTGNWHTTMRVEVTNPGNPSRILDYSGLVTDNSGEGAVNLCTEGVILEDKPYDMYITGEAHLRKRFSSEAYSNLVGSIVNLTTGGRVLLAGDTSVIKDEKINSLDISTQIRTLYTGDGHNDLNKDSRVNSLDVSNTIYNFYLLGD